MQTFAGDCDNGQVNIIFLITYVSYSLKHVSENIEKQMELCANSANCCNNSVYDR